LLRTDGPTEVGRAAPIGENLVDCAVDPVGFFGQTERVA
jgi:hypothetical protein